MPAEHRANPLLLGAVAAGGLMLTAVAVVQGAPRDPALRRVLPLFRRGGDAAPTHGRETGRPPQRDAEHPPGRHAAHPKDIPPRGWWQILKRTVAEISNDRVLTEAAGVTFYALLALFPAIAALISIYGLFAEPATISDHLDMVGGVIPGGGMEIIGDQVKRITEKGDSALGFGAIIGLGSALLVGPPG